MKILNLHVENIKKIKVVDITPSGNSVIISGKNANGKTSTMDAIAMALGGAKLIPEKPVREGQEEARITVDLGDYLVTRWWTSPLASYLKLETKDGAKVTNAQTILDKLIGDLTFDPLEFATMEPGKRLKTLRAITKVDFTDLDEKHKVLYEQRRDTGRDGEQAKAMLSQYADIEAVDHPSDEAIGKVREERKAAQEINRNIDKALADAGAVTAKIDFFNKNISNINNEIAKLQSQKESIQKEVANQGVVKADFLQTAQKEKIDVSGFDSEVEKYQKIKADYKRFQDKRAAESKVTELRSKWSSLDESLKEINESKREMLSNATMPIEGLGFGDAEITFNGIPFSQLSTSEQIRVSFSIAIAMNPRLRVAMIKNGSLLDDDAMKEIEKISETNDFQVWIEIVGNGPDANSIYIENGEIKSDKKN